MNKLFVERLMEYQRAARMPPLQCFIRDLEKRMKLAGIFHQVQNVFFCILKRKHFVQNVVG
jgi:hypothetical protein